MSALFCSLLYTPMSFLLLSPWVKGTGFSPRLHGKQQNRAGCHRDAFRTSVIKSLLPQPHDAYFNNEQEKLFYGSLIKADDEFCLCAKNWITHFMNQISTTAFGFVRKVIHIYGPIFQQDKYDTRQDFPEVNIVNNKRLCQGKLRNDLILTSYSTMPKCHHQDPRTNGPFNKLISWWRECKAL